MSEALKAAEAKRAERKALAQAARDEQAAIDVDAIDALEASLGDAAVKVIDVPHLKGHVAKVAFRSPNSAEMKRFRDMVKPDRNGKPQDAVVAHELLGESVRVYPSAEAFEALCERLTGLKGQMGVLAETLSRGEAEQAGKS